jgi:putative lipoic acid-binding regulatory protein
MTERQTLLEFPCQFPIKAIGRGDDLDSVIFALIHPHVPDLSEGALSLRPSGKGNFMAVTVTITATSQSQLDAIYQELTVCKQVIMAL